MTSSPSSIATVATDRPARYAKQLTAHMARKVQTSWDDAAATGTVDFPTGHLDLSCSPASLRLELRADAADLARWEQVVGVHLVRFGTRDELVVQWRRADGSEGTRQAGESD